jgi:hypothetical protein
MGMYDTVYFHCPTCGNRISTQSKGGPCELNEYHINDTPADVAGSLHETEFTCNACHARWKLDVKTTVSVRRD